MSKGPTTALVIALALAPSCSRRSPPPPEPRAVTAPPEPSVTAAPAPPRERPGDLNVLLITVDSLRADMPWAGYPRPIAPAMTAFAESAVVYDRFYSIS